MEGEMQWMQDTMAVNSTEGAEETGKKEQSMAKVATTMAQEDRGNIDLTMQDDDEERALRIQRVPFLRELLTTFHRVSNLPERVSLQEERLYGGEMRGGFLCRQTKATSADARSRRQPRLALSWMGQLFPSTSIQYRRGRFRANHTARSLWSWTRSLTRSRSHS